MGKMVDGKENKGFIRRWPQRSLGCLTILVILILGYFGLYLLLRGGITSSPQLIAHRGGPVYNPENTIAAFQYAIEQGVDWIEFDVQRTKDGTLVVIHDDTIDRTTDGTGLVGDLTLAEMEELDAGNGEKVPTFKQVITLAQENGVGILPEAKSPELYPGIAEQMVAVIDDQGFNDQTIIQSFDSATLVDVRQHNPNQAVCPLYGLWQFDLSNPVELNAEYVCPMAEMVLLYPWMIRQAHRDGKDVYVWFGIIENPLIMRILLGLGADGLMVDDPVALAEIIRR